MKNLVLLGGGYGNMRIMSHILPNALPADYTLTLVDRMPYHGLKQNFMHWQPAQSLIQMFA